MKTQSMLSKLIYIAPLVFVLQACGGGGGSAGEPAGDNSPPQISDKSIDYVRSGKTYSFTPTATDPENNSLQFTIENKPVWASFNQKTGTLSGSPIDSHVKTYEDIIITASDGSNSVALPAFSLKVMFPEVNRDNIAPAQTASVTNTAEGFTVVGDATIAVGNLVTEFKNADLQFEFDDEGNLLDVAGVGELPPAISDNLSLDASVNTIIGMYTGAEINANVDIGPDSDPGILVRDEFRYIVYFLNTSVDLTFHAGDGEDEQIPLNVAGSQTLIVTDPTDPMFYYYGSVAGSSLGFGYSHNNNIPYVPMFDAAGPVAFDALESFNAQAVLKGDFPIASFKVFDLVIMSGTAYCLPPQLFDCSKPSPIGLVASLAQELIEGNVIDPSQQFRLGINGTAEFGFTILGIDLFKYELFDIAASADIGTTREYLAVQGVIDPQESEQPAWIPFKPVPALNGKLVANLHADVATVTGEGDFEMSIYGDIDSTFPEAKMNGSIYIGTYGINMNGYIDDPDNPITVSATVNNDGLDARVEFAYDIQGNIDQVVDQGLDTAIQEANQAFDELENAIGNYNFALSIEGFRSQIPAIVDTTKGILDSIPGKVYTSVYNSTKSNIESASFSGYDAKDFVSASGIASTEATTARNTAQSNINTIKAELDNLKAQALQSEDGPAFRTALKTALNQAISRATYSQTITVKRTITFLNLPGTCCDISKTFTFYSGTHTYTVIDTNTKNNLQTAANNVDNIGPNETIMISTQDIYDSIPKEEIIEQTRANKIGRAHV